MKTIFLIPGFTSSMQDNCYQWLVSFLKQRGFSVVPVEITWKYRTIDHWVEEFVKVYNENCSEKNYVLGFSFGASVAFLSAVKVKIDGLFLCSPSPCFKEDYKPFGAKMKKFFGKRRIEASRKYSAYKISQELNIPVIVFYGEKEGRCLIKRSREIAHWAPRGKSICVDEAGHQIDHPNYIRSLKTHLR